VIVPVKLEPSSMVPSSRSAARASESSFTVNRRFRTTCRVSSTARRIGVGDVIRSY
jgi:uncharacterized protein (DUF1499 family)